MRKHLRTRKRFMLVFILIIPILTAVSVLFFTAQTDSYCVSRHTPTTQKPTQLITPQDYFTQGDFEYETGNCQNAIDKYNQAIIMNPQYAEAYNNRAYTYMRLKNYPAALSDLDNAINIRPDYVHALMNRGDIYNYYYAINRKQAVADYNRVIALDGTKDMTVCGHRLLAKTGGWNLNTVWQLLTKGISAGCRI